MATSNFLRQLPIIGKDVAKVGQILELANNPCNISPFVAAYAFFNCVPFVVWSIVKPDPLDYVGERFSLRTGKHKKIRFKAKETQVPDVEISRGLGWAKWSYDLSQRIGWWLAIVAGTLDAEICWMSTAYQIMGCDDPTLPAAHGEGVANYYFPGWHTSAGGWQWTRHCYEQIYDLLVPYGSNGSWTFTATSKPWLSNVGTIDGWRLVNAYTGVPYFERMQDPGRSNPDAFNDHFRVYSGFGPDSRYTIQFHVSGSGVTDVHFQQSFLGNPHGLFLDPDP